MHDQKDDSQNEQEVNTSCCDVKRDPGEQPDHDENKEQH